MGNGWVRSPTHVQTNLEISVKLQKSLFLYIGVGVPCMYTYCYFLLFTSPAMKNCWDPSRFYGCLGRCCAVVNHSHQRFVKILVRTSFPKDGRFRRLFRLCRLSHIFLAELASPAYGNRLMETAFARCFTNASFMDFAAWPSRDRILNRESITISRSDVYIINEVCRLSATMNE